MGGKSHAQDPHTRPHTLLHAMTNTKSKIKTQKIGTKTQTLCCVGRLMSIKGTSAPTTQPVKLCHTKPQIQWQTKIKKYANTQKHTFTYVYNLCSQVQCGNDHTQHRGHPAAHFINIKVWKRGQNAEIVQDSFPVMKTEKCGLLVLGWFGRTWWSHVLWANDASRLEFMKLFRNFSFTGS